MDPTRTFHLTAAIVLAAAGAWCLLPTRPRRRSEPRRPRRVLHRVRTTLLLAICAAVAAMTFSGTAHADADATSCTPIVVGGISITTSCGSSITVPGNSSNTSSGSSPFVPIDPKLTQDPVTTNPPPDPASRLGQYLTDTGQNIQNAVSGAQKTISDTANSVATVAQNILNNTSTATVQPQPQNDQNNIPPPVPQAQAQPQDLLDNALKSFQNGETAVDQTKTTDVQPQPQDDQNNIQNVVQNDLTTAVQNNVSTPVQSDTTAEVQDNPVAEARPTEVAAETTSVKDRQPQDTPPVQQDPACELTDEQLQQALDQAMARQAADEQRFTQEFVKNLLEQVTSKTTSALVQQELAGHNPPTAKDITDLVANGLITPADVAQALQQTLHDIGQDSTPETAQEQGTSCTEPAPLNPSRSEVTRGNSGPSQDRPQTAGNSENPEGDKQNPPQGTPGGGTPEGDASVPQPKASKDLSEPKAPYDKIAESVVNAVDYVKSKMREAAEEDEQLAALPKDYTVAVMAVTTKDHPENISLIATVAGGAAKGDQGRAEQQAMFGAVNEIINAWNAKKPGQEITLYDQWTQINPNESRHAEHALSQWVKQNGYIGGFAGATRPICLGCFTDLTQSDIFPLTSLATNDAFTFEEARARGIQSGKSVMKTLDPLASFRPDGTSLPQNLTKSTLGVARKVLKKVTANKEWNQPGIFQKVEQALKDTAEGKPLADILQKLRNR